MPFGRIRWTVTVVRIALSAAGSVLALLGMSLALAAVLSPGSELNPFQASPERPEVNLLTGVGLLFVAVLLFAQAARRRAEEEGTPSAGW